MLSKPPGIAQPLTLPARPRTATGMKNVSSCIQRFCNSKKSLSPCRAQRELLRGRSRAALSLPGFRLSVTLAEVQEKSFTIAMDCFAVLSRLGTNTLSLIRHTGCEIPLFPSLFNKRIFKCRDKPQTPAVGFCCPPTASQDSR